MSEAIVTLKVCYGFGEVDKELVEAMLEESEHWGDFSAKIVSIEPIEEPTDD